MQNGQASGLRAGLTRRLKLREIPIALSVVAVSFVIHNTYSSFNPLIAIIFTLVSLIYDDDRIVILRMWLMQG